MKAHNNENDGSTEWDKLERELFLRFHTDTSSLLNSEEEREKTLEGIRRAHTEALKFFNSDDFKNAEQELIKVLRPVLSKPEMKALYVDVKDVLEETLSAMYHLGLIYLNTSNYFNNHAKAAAIFQYCSEFSKEYKVSIKLDEDITSDTEYFIRQAQLVENRLCQDIGVDSDFNPDEAIAKSREYKEELKQFRNTIEQELESINDLGIDQIEARADEVKNIYNNCTRFFVNHSQNQNTAQAHDSSQNPGLVQRLLKDCYKQLEPVYPEGCKYAIVGLGSLSLGTMNPWSDLEFAVLINEEKEEYKEYLRNLTKLLWIKVINLQETPLSALGVEALNNYSTGKEQDNWFNDNLTQKAFRFDPVYEDACKSPLGRHGNYKVKEKVKSEESELETETTIAKPDYELIMTPEQMLVFQHEEVQFPEEYGNIKNWFEADKHLSQALQTASLIDGSPILLKDYKKKLKGFQSNNPELHKGRALELLNEDVRKFSLKLGDKEEGKLLDAKQTIYRLGDRIVSALAGYYGITAEDDESAITVWQIIDEMKAQGILGDKGAKHFSEAISIATELRIRTYSHNKGRYDNISTYEPVITDRLIEEKRKELIEKTFYFKDIDILKHFYYVMLRVQDLVKGFCNQNSHNLAELVLKFDNLLADNNYAKGMVHARFLEYTLALKYLEAAKEEKPDNLKVLHNLFFLYNKTGTVEQTVSIGNDILKLVVAKHQNNLNHPIIAMSYNNLGTAYYRKGHYGEAITYHNQALEIQLKAYESSPNHPDIATSYNNLGLIYYNKGNYGEAIKYYKLALEIWLKNPNHPDIAKSCDNLGEAYRAKSSYDKAIKYHTLALEIKLKVYQSNPNHPGIAGSYDNLGASSKDKGSYDEAIKYYNLALEILLKAYKTSPNHPAVALSYNNLGEAYRAKGSYDEAIKYYNLALEILLKAYESNPNHPDIAVIYNNLGAAYGGKDSYDKAMEYCNLAFEIRLKAYEPNPNHPDIAKSYNCLGNICRAKGSYDGAIEYYNLALEIELKVYESNPNHPDIARSYHNLGNAYREKGNYDEAIEYYNLALEINLKAYETNPNHPDIAANYNNLGAACSAKGSCDEAIEYYNLALEINLKAYEMSPNHPDIAANYYNLGNAYRAKGSYDEAIEYYNLALEINLKAYEMSPNHPDIAASYNGLGNAYREKGNYDEAIKYCNLALEINLKAWESNPSHPDIAGSYNNLGAAHLNKGEYKQAHLHAQKALEIFLKCEAPQYLSMARTLYNVSLVQLGNLALLEGNGAEAREYYKGINQRYEQVDFASKEFINLQLRYENTAYKNKLLLVAINCQKVLIKFAPELEYGNHYHNLGCFYTCQGNIEGANQAFTNALTHPNAKVTGGLHAEYAQFLIVYKDNEILKVDPPQISKHLYAAINSDNPGGLQYGKIEQGTVCNILQNLIMEKNDTIIIDPKVLAYYLLTAYSEYIREGDNIETLLESFKCYCEDLQDEISFRLLSDAYKGNGHEEAAIKYVNCANLIDQVDKIISGKLKLSSEKCTIKSSEIEDYAIALDQLALVAISESRLNGVSKFYTTLFKIYNLVLTDQPKQLQLAINNLATFSLLINNVEQYIGLKFKFGAELHHDLITRLGQNVEQIVMIEQHIMAQIQTQAQIAMQPHRTNESTVARENTESEVSTLGENEEFN